MEPVVTDKKRPDPEVPAKAKRRQFSAAYKLRILREADALRSEGKGLGSLLRREGLYTSHLSEWGRAREQGGLGALEPQKRGPKPDPDAALKVEIERLRRENERLQKRLERAELVIDVQKKVSRLLGVDLASG
jgi:transposase-like protein